MVNRDIDQTCEFKQMAGEAIAGMRLDRSRVLASLPHRTLLLDFVNAVAPLDIDQTIARFPLICEAIAERHNNPLEFDWLTLSLAVDNLHGHYVAGIGNALNTR